MTRDENKLAALKLVDYSKAFDAMDHDVLEDILYHNSFSEATVSLIMSYITDLWQAMKILDCASCLEWLSTGVPQASILSPLLFIIYTSSLSNALKDCKDQVYSDDSQTDYSFLVAEHVFALETVRVEDLVKLHDVCSRPSLCLSAGKSAKMLFGRSNDRDKFLIQILMSLMFQVVLDSFWTV